MSEQAYSGWDKNLDFQEWIKRLIALVGDMTIEARKRAYYAIFLTQLGNGSRIGEAVDCMIKWVGNGKVEQSVRVEKRKDNYHRLMIIPPIIRKDAEIKQAMQEIAKFKNPKAAAEMFLHRAQELNTHAFRYSFISHNSDKPAQLIASMTGHKKLDHILHYTNRKAGEQELRRLFK